MSRFFQVTFDCGYVYSTQIYSDLSRFQRRAFDMIAETDHEQKCTKCREQAAAAELTQLNQEMGLE